MSGANEVLDNGSITCTLRHVGCEAAPPVCDQGPLVLHEPSSQCGSMRAHSSGRERSMHCGSTGAQCLGIATTPYHAFVHHAVVLSVVHKDRTGSPVVLVCLW